MPCTRAKSNIDEIDPLTDPPELTSLKDQLDKVLTSLKRPISSDDVISNFFIIMIVIAAIIIVISIIIIYCKQCRNRHQQNRWCENWDGVRIKYNPTINPNN